MTQREINRLEMFQAVKTYLDTHSAKWNSIVVAGRYKNQLTTAIDALKAAARDHKCLIEQHKLKPYAGESKRLVKTSTYRAKKTAKTLVPLRLNHSFKTSFTYIKLFKK